MIWFLFLIMGALALGFIFFGLTKKAPLLLFLSAFFLVIIGILIFSQGIDFPSGTKETRIINATDSNYMTVDTNITYLTYTTSNEPIMNLIAYLSFVIGAILLVVSFVYFRQ